MSGLSRKAQKGLSLVELMVGIAVGMIVTAAATVLVSGQLTESRRLVAEAQVQQDLRATADIITRELRRTGAIGSDTFLLSQLWAPGSVSDPEPTPFATLTPAAPDPADSPVSDDQTGFDYAPSATSTQGPFGFRLDASTGVIQTLLVAGGWQDLTDPNTLTVSNFTVTRLHDTVHRVPCVKACTGPDPTACWPTMSIRAFEVSITAASRAVPGVTRTHRSQVRVRNDLFSFHDAPGRKVCPS
jgi:Tfp pilus assembly protein PilW